MNSLGLIQEIRIEDRFKSERNDYEVTIIYFLLTLMGYEFFKAVTDCFPIR
jgi:hypothetical protein